MSKNAFWWISYYRLGCAVEQVSTIYKYIKKITQIYQKIRVIFIQIYVTGFFA